MTGSLSATVILLIILAYFLVLIGISWYTGRKSDNANFFLAGRNSPWYVVAFGMIGASLSGVTFISIPGVVGQDGIANTDFSYMQMVLGYLVGYAFIALMLMPLYYRMQLTSIYGYLAERFGGTAYRTGAGFFLLSRTIGASFRLFLVAMVLHEFVMAPLFGLPFWITVAATIGLIWVYTFKGGIGTIIWTDTLQTTCMLLSVGLTIYGISSALEMDLGGLFSMVRNSEYSQVFHFENGWSDPNNFFKQFLAGALIATVMTGLDQDMMQKNLSCRTLQDAQKNMFTFSIILVFANLLFLVLGALLYIYANSLGLPTPAPGDADQLFPTIALERLGPAVGVFFILGLIAAAYSSADSALTSLTTSFCVDFLGFKDQAPPPAATEGYTDAYYDETVLDRPTALDEVPPTGLRERMFGNRSEEWVRTAVHIGFSVLLLLTIIAFWLINDESVINKLFKVAGFTYGPLLGLFSFGILTKLRINDRLSLVVCLVAPVLTFLFDRYSTTLFFGYKFGFELLLLNGLLTFVGLALIAYYDHSETEMAERGSGG